MGILNSRLSVFTVVSQSGRRRRGARTSARVLRVSMKLEGGETWNNAL